MLVTSPTISKTFPAGRGALQFQGTGDRVEFPDLKVQWPIENFSPYTVELWLRPMLPQGNREQIVLYANPEKAGEASPFILKIKGDGTVQAGHDKDRLLEFERVLTFGVWQHLAFVFAGVSAARFHVNGERKKDGEFKMRSKPWLNGFVVSSPIRRESLDGQIAMLRIWKIDRFEWEIRRFMYDRITGVDRYWLVAEWLVNEGFGENLFDASRKLARSRDRNLFDEPGAGRLAEGETKRKPEWVASAVPHRPSRSALGIAQVQIARSVAPFVSEKGAETQTGMFLTEFPDREKDISEARDRFSLEDLSFTVEFWLKRYGGLQSDVQYVIFAQSPLFLPGPEPELLLIGLAAQLPGLAFFMSFGSMSLSVPCERDENWHHWACVYRHAATPADCKRLIFSDGDNIGEDNAVYRVTEARPFLLWTAGYLGENYAAAPCMLSDVRVWRQARSEEEIRANMLRRLDGTEPGLLLYCPLDRADQLPDKTIVARARVRPGGSVDKPMESRRFPTEGYQRRVSWVADGPPIPPRSGL